MPDRWISLHAFHQDGTDLLLGTAVDGLVRELDGRLDRFFFLRYWEGGPHLRLRLLPRVPGDAPMIERRATAVLEEHLAAHPTTVTWDRARYALLARELARQEGLAAYDHRLRPDDRVEAVAYRPEYATFGGPEAVTAVERHFTDSSRIALAILRGEPDRRRRLGHALAAMMLTVIAGEPGPRGPAGERDHRNPAQSREHDRRDPAPAGERDSRDPAPVQEHDHRDPAPVQEHDHWEPAPVREHDRWDPAPARSRQMESFARQREALAAQAERCRRVAARATSSDGHSPDGHSPADRSTVDRSAVDRRAGDRSAGGTSPGGLLDAGDAHGSLGAWWRSIDTLHRRLVALRRAGRFSPAHGEGPSRGEGAAHGEGASRTLDGPDAPAGPRVPGSPGAAAAGTSADAERHDVLIVLNRCVHLFCNRLGLSIAEEAHLRYLTAVTLDSPARKEETS